MPFTSEDVFLTTEELLAYLQVNLRTVYRLIKAGRIPAVRVGRQWRFRKRDIDAWLDAQRRNTDAPAVGRRTGPSSAKGRSRVLVVEDESSVRDLLSRTLVMADYEVDTAADAQGALERLRRQHYDLLLADLPMPGLDGLSIVREARRVQEHLPVVVITGFSSETTAIDALNMGVSGYLTKPFRAPQVLEAAARAIGA